MRGWDRPNETESRIEPCLSLRHYRQSGQWKPSRLPPEFPGLNVKREGNVGIEEKPASMLADQEVRFFSPINP
jgi:hypothetical protein